PRHDDRLQSRLRSTNGPSPTYLICDGSTKAKWQSSPGRCAEVTVKTHRKRAVGCCASSELPPSEQIHSRLSLVILPFLVPDFDIPDLAGATTKWDRSSATA